MAATRQGRGSHGSTTYHVTTRQGKRRCRVEAESLRKEPHRPPPSVRPGPRGQPDASHPTTKKAAGAPQEGGRARGQGVVGPVSRPSQFLQDLEPDLEPLEPDLEPESTVA
ncbi:MAG: hypothetical protein AMXMBFR64_43480 [Myxococcales bacterium]